MAYTADYDIPSCTLKSTMQSHCPQNTPKSTEKSAGQHYRRRKLCISCDQYADGHTSYCRSCNDIHRQKTRSRQTPEYSSAVDAVGDVTLSVARMGLDVAESAAETTTGVLGDVLNVPLHLLSKADPRPDPIVVKIRGMSSSEQARMIFDFARKHYRNDAMARDFTNDLMNNPDRDAERVTFLVSSLRKSSGRASGAKASLPSVAKKSEAKVSIVLPSSQSDVLSKKSGSVSSSPCACAECTVESACVSAAAKASGTKAESAVPKHAGMREEWGRRNRSFDKVYRDDYTESRRPMVKSDLFGRADRNNRNASGCHSSSDRQNRRSRRTTGYPDSRNSSSRGPSVRDQLQNSGFTYNCYSCQSKVYESPVCHCGAKVPASYLDDFLVSSGAYSGAKSGGGFMDSLLESAEGLNMVFGL